MRKGASAIRYPNRKEPGRSKKRGRGSFRIDAQVLAPRLSQLKKFLQTDVRSFSLELLAFSCDWKKINLYESKYTTTAQADEDLIPTFSTSKKTSDRSQYSSLNVRLRAGFAELVSDYINKLKNAEQKAKDHEIERTLREAYENRKIIEALIENNGLGLQLLVELRAGGKLKFSEFVSKNTVSEDDAVGMLAHLVSGKAVTIEASQFVCTDRGFGILESFERNVGVNLGPED
jgi:hypothetical protein